MKISHRFLAYFSLPVLVVGIASFQLYKTETTDLSRWKGGGFGMYTNINEAFNVIVINDSIYSNSNFNKKTLNQKNNYINKLLYNPTDKNTELFLSLLNNKKEVKKLQIFEPVFDPNNYTLTYKLRYEKIIQ